MKQPRKQKKRHFVFDIKPNQPLTVYDIYSRFAMELRLVEKPNGQQAIDFLIPGSFRIARGSLN